MVPEQDDDGEVERFTREQAVQIAQAEAKRDFSEQEGIIRYVAYIPEMHAHCACEFVLHEGTWLKSYRLLIPAEWQSDEEIRDETILDVARSGSMVSAIMLYRAKYGVGLKDGHAGVQRLLWGGSTNDA